MEVIWTSTPAPPTGQLFRSCAENSTKKSTSFYWDETDSLLVSRGFALEDLSEVVNMSGNREPEDHLEYLIRSWPSLRHLQNARILALTPKDFSLGNALERRGNNVTELFASQSFSIESKQFSFPYYVCRLTTEIEKLDEVFDCILVRHVLEHLDDTKRFLASLKRVLKPDGFIFVEVPNVGPQIRIRDYTMLWDEHKSYFTEINIKNLLTSAAWHIDFLDDIYAGGEQVVCVSARPKKFSEGSLTAGIDKSHFKECQEYFRDIGLRRRNIFSKASNRRVLFLGANHSTATLLNIFGDVLSEVCIIDESPDKVGYCMSLYCVKILKPQDVTVRVNDLIVSCINRTRSRELEIRLTGNLSFDPSIVQGSAFCLASPPNGNPGS